MKRERGNKRRTKLKVGDPVVVIAGGSPKKQLKGKIGKIKAFVGNDRVLVEGVNMIKVHERQGPSSKGGIVVREGAIHISNVMYYV
ncbi:MAG: 50S ribosomal protein L24, partial [Candidatus Dadabacteria bacterium]